MESSRGKILVLIKISGTSRIPELETEIFEDMDLTYAYLGQLLPQYDAPINPESCSWMIYHYAKHVLKSRWPEAERRLVRNHWESIHAGM